MLVHTHPLSCPYVQHILKLTRLDLNNTMHAFIRAHTLNSDAHTNAHIHAFLRAHTLNSDTHTHTHTYTHIPGNRITYTIKH